MDLIITNFGYFVPVNPITDLHQRELVLWEGRVYGVVNPHIHGLLVFCSTKLWEPSLALHVGSPNGHPGSLVFYSHRQEGARITVKYRTGDYFFVFTTEPALRMGLF